MVHSGAESLLITQSNPPSANLIPLGFGLAYLRGVVVPI